MITDKSPINQFSDTVSELAKIKSPTKEEDKIFDKEVNEISLQTGLTISELFFVDTCRCYKLSELMNSCLCYVLANLLAKQPKEVINFRIRLKETP